MQNEEIHDPKRPAEIQSNREKSDFSSAVERTHARLVAIGDAGCIYVQIRERYQMHENIIKQQQFLLLPLRRILLRILVHLIDRLVFLPCVEVIPEHTDRAARIKQSRVKMMRLKAKNRKRRTRDGRARVGREKKSDQRIFRGGDKNI